MYAVPIYRTKTGLSVYANDKRCVEFIKFIAQSIKESIIADIKKSEFYSILLDSSTDKSTTVQLVLYAKYCIDGELKESFLGIVELNSATAEEYFQAVQVELKEYGLHWNETEKLVGLGTDGVASMIGCTNGLATKIKKEVKH